MDRHNLFRFATKEISHSAFWAWIFQATDSEDEVLEGPRAVGRAALQRFVISSPDGKVTVETEVPFPTGDRPDVKVEFGDESALFVELKRSAPFSEEQIKSYEEVIGDRGTVALISTRFDVEDAEGICPYLELDDIQQILAPHRDSHPLLSDYAEWIDERVERRDEICEKAFADHPEKVEEALSTLYGQRLVMEKATREMSGRWKQSQANLGGDPYTEFRFAEATGEQDALFYRIDEYSPGYYISLKQYLGSKDMEAWEGKEGRLEELRRCWEEAKEEVSHGLHFRGPHNRGSKTCEVGCLLFKYNPPATVAEDLPKVHKALAKRLEENGWDLTVDNCGAQQN